MIRIEVQVRIQHFAVGKGGAAVVAQKGLQTLVHDLDVAGERAIVRKGFLTDRFLPILIVDLLMHF